MSLEAPEVLKALLVLAFDECDIGGGADLSGAFGTGTRLDPDGIKPLNEPGKRGQA